LYGTCREKRKKEEKKPVSQYEGNSTTGEKKEKRKINVYKE